MPSIRSTLLFFSCSILSAIYVTFSLRPNCRQVVQSACHYVQTEQSLIEKQHCEQRAKRRCSEAIAAVAAAVRQYPCNVRFSSARFFPFLCPTTWCLFSFSEVKMSIGVVICVPSSSSAVVFLSSPCCYSPCHSPQAAPSPSSCQLLETTLTV